MNRNALYVVIGVLAVVSVVLGYQYYRERNTAQTVEISIGKGGISIEKK
jgi:hypothetical protein